MITTQNLLKEIKKALDDCQTFHCVIVDSEVYNKEITDSTIACPGLRNLAWLEPEEGIYIINLEIMLHFKNKMTSITRLFKELINTGHLVVSKRYKVPQYLPKFQFDKKIKKQTYIALVTLFSPNAQIDLWVSFIKNMYIPKNTKLGIYIGNNTGCKNLQETIKNKLKKFTHKYDTLEILDLGKPYKSKINANYFEVNKHAHVAMCYSNILKELVDYYDYILKLEDDMNPPKEGLKNLFSKMKILEKSKKVASVAGVYRQKADPEFACISMQPVVWGKTPKIENIPFKTFEVKMQGGGFALYNSLALKECLPYRLTFKLPGGNYYMTGWDGTLGEDLSTNGWTQYCDGSLYCEHIF